MEIQHQSINVERRETLDPSTTPNGLLITVPCGKAGVAASTAEEVFRDTNILRYSIHTYKAKNINVHSKVVAVTTEVGEGGVLQASVVEEVGVLHISSSLVLSIWS